MSVRRSLPSATAFGFAALLGFFMRADAAGQSGTWTTRGPVGGSVYCLVPDPSRPATIYAGTARGVFKSDDGGASWRAANSGLPVERVQTIAIDPTATGTLYAGTLTPNGVESVGIFKSTDGGASWTAVNEGLIDPLTGVSPLDVWSLAIDPRNPKTILAGTRFSEIFRSTDGGLTWQSQTFGGFTLSLETTAFRIDPANSSTILAASTAGLLRSLDGGTTWFGFGNAGDSFFTLVADPATPATLYGGNIGGAGIFKSTDGGAHWNGINNGLPTNQGATGARPLLLAFAVDPARPATLYVGTYGNGVYKSSDGGANWTSANGAMRSAYVSALGFGPSPALLAGTLGGGVYRSADGAGTWTPASNGLDLAQVTSLAADPSAGTVFASVFDGVYRSADGGQTWQAVNNGLPVAPVSALVAKPGNPRTLLAATLGGGILKSTDGGASWSASAQGLTDPFAASLALDPANAQVLYAGTNHSSSASQRVFKSADGGATWTQTSLDAKQFPITAIAVNPARTAQVAAVSHGVSGYYQSLDSGGTWAVVTTDANCGGVNAVLFDPSGATTYLAGSAAVCRSTDGGKTWTPIPLPNFASAEAFLLDTPSPPGTPTLYAGGDGGVFRSTDGGQTWQAVGSGLSGTVTSLVADPSRGILHAGLASGSVAELVPDQSRSPVLPVPPGNPGTRVVPPR